MQTYNIHYAKTQSSKLVEQAAKGSAFIIAKTGKPMVKVIPITSPDVTSTRRIDFMAGQIEIPDDFDHMGTA